MQLMVKATMILIAMIVMIMTIVMVIHDDVMM
jgi:hypothetical protein